MKFSDYLAGKDKGDILPYIEYKAATSGITFQEAASRSLARVFSQIDSGDNVIVILTAFRHERDITQNRELNRQLGSQIRQLGWGYTPVLGGYLEEGPEGQQRVHEESLFVNAKGDRGQVIPRVLELIGQYQQESALVKFPNDEQAYLLFANGETAPVGKWHADPKLMAQYYTRMRKGPEGRQFTFEAAGDNSVMTRMAMHYWNKTRTLSEHGYARVGRMLRGFVPNVKTVGIITGENPQSTPASPQSNNQANERLEKELRLRNLGFTKVKGQYGSLENSYLVPNIRKDELLSLGQQFEQTSVIYGERTETEKDGKKYDGMVFQMVFTDHRFGQVDSERRMFINVQDAEDFFSMVKGRKFRIPFYDDEYENAEFTPQSGMVQKTPSLPESVVNEANWSVERSLSENITGHGRWLERGHIKTLLKRAT